MRELREFALAEFASVGFDSGVDSHVLREVGGIGEAFGARGAFVRLRVLLVHVMGMPQHVRLGFERLVRAARSEGQKRGRG